MATRKLIVYPNKDLMIQAGAQRFVLALLDLLAERLPDGTHRTRVDVALSGGSAAQPLGLVLNDPLADAIDWSRVHFWWSDERFVPAYDTDRNALEARRLLLDQKCTRDQSIASASGSFSTKPSGCAAEPPDSATSTRVR